MSTHSNADLAKRMEDADNAEFSKFHWRMIFTAGTGFFTDAYDLFIIGVVTAILTPIWHLTTHQTAILNGASLAAAAFGAVMYGFLSDKFGRKKMYGTEMIILFFGAIISACAKNFTWLLIARVIVGFGIGGDYPSSAVVASESANKANRGFLVLLVFAMQAVGMIFGPLLAALLLAMHIQPDHVWRLLLGFGALPAASVIYLRRTIKESARYLLNKQSPVEVSRVVAEVSGVQDQPQIAFEKQSLFSGKWLKCLIGTAGAWFCMDVAFYGCGVSNTMILKAIDPSSSLMAKNLITAAIMLVFAFPGYLLAAKKVDTIGRKTLQFLGFTMMIVCYAVVAYFTKITSILPLFVLVYGLTFFFVNFGPNTTTFLVPSEVFPTAIRAKGHGMSAAIAKIGAAIGAFALPLLLASKGLSFTLGLMGVVCFLGILFTMLLPEMKNMSLTATETIRRTDATN